MSHPSHPFDFSHLSTTERILLAEDLWDSIAAEQDVAPLSGEQQQELQHRLAITDRGDMVYSSWREVKRRVTHRE